MEAKNTPPADAISTAEAAALLGLDVTGVTRHARAGRLPAWRIGRDWLFSRAAVLAFRPPPRGRRPKTSPPE